MSHVTRMLAAGLLAFMAGVPGRADVASTNTHWAYQPLVRPAVPDAPGTRIPPRNPIDRFILARLAAEGLAPSPEADRRTLLRRVYFDLTGLPPTPEEVAAFERECDEEWRALEENRKTGKRENGRADLPSSRFPVFSFSGAPAPLAYEQLVDRLLASPRYGERWARHWMDAVHFAETHGHDQDRIRTNAWPYRDYLIASFNADKPYARFVQEQVAGDALFPAEPQATVALGMIAAGPWDESSLRDIREDTLDRQIARYLDRDDMVTTVMSTFTSTTVHCARCHDHKFDPIPQTDYYALQAVFAGTDRGNRWFDDDPAIHQRRQELRRQQRLLERKDAAFRESLLQSGTQAAVAAWEQTLANRVTPWTPLEPVEFKSADGATLSRQADGSVLSGGNRPERDTVTISGPAPLQRITAIRLEVLTDDSLPKRGPGRQDNGNLHLSEIEAFADGAKLALVNASADFNQDGWTIAHTLDGDEKTAWGIYPKVGQPHEAVFELKSPTSGARPAKLTVILKQLHGGGHLIGRARVSVTDAGLPIRINSFPDDIARVLTTPASVRTPAQRIELASFWLKESLEKELAALPVPRLIYAGASDFVPDASHVPVKAPRPIHLLRRGEITKPADAAAPGALACVGGLSSRFDVPDEADESARRVALARWLTAEQNPLTWRSIVNRVWHLHFGRGLVETPNDFGRMGAVPSHPELLDWLAVWFRDDAHGSLKALHRLIVTSAAYRQSSLVVDHEDTKTRKQENKTVVFSGLPVFLSSQQSAANAVVDDSDNRLLWRMNRTRLDAECIRDAVLAITGRLDLRMGGPSDMQFDLQPGIHVTPRVDYSKFDVDSGLGRRRGVYRFLFRTLPDPFMDALDCPAGDQLAPVRNNSVTVQQALALWNNAFIAAQAGHFAERLERERPSLESQITRAFELAFNREPSADEAASSAAYARRHGLASLCRLLFNANEFVFVN